MKLTPARLFGRRPLEFVPSQPKLSADGRYGSFLLPADDDRERLELWLVDTATAEANRLLRGDAGDASAAPETAVERDERERRRQFAHGVTAYEWHPEGHWILFPAQGAACLAAVPEGTVRPLTAPGTRQTGIRFSAKGSFVSYVRDGDLYALRVADGAERRLTEDGGGTVANGLPEFIAEEEMHRFDGHWWSPDERFVAFARVDAAPIPETRRHEMDADGIRVVPQRYPFAGGANAEVRLGLLELATGATTWLAWQAAAEDYLARVAFAPDGALVVQAQSRDQRRLAVRRYAGEEWQELFVETAETWINLHDNLEFLEDGRFLWTSERDGASQLYLYDAAGRQARQLSAGLGRVNRVLAADDDHAWVTGWRSDPTTQGIYRVGLQRGALDQADLVAATDWWVEGVASRKAKLGLAVVKTATAAARLAIFEARLGILKDAKAGLVRTPRRKIGTGGPCRLLSLPRPTTPDIGADAVIGALPSASEFDAAHAAAEPGLAYRLTKPSPWQPQRRYPVVVHVYGGPGVQRVRQETPPLVVRLFAQAGFGVFELDNRGSANRGKRFEDAIHGRLGHAEVADQLAGVAFLRRQDWVDPDRIGIFGHSYGGYMVLMCLAQSHAFAAGAAVAPVTDWALYDTHYAERYLGLPADNPQGYAASAVAPRVADIDAPLLLMHGMADDNVLFAHSLALMDALQAAGKPFELMTYPGAKHALQERSVAVHRYEHILEFFRRRLAKP